MATIKDPSQAPSVSGVAPATGTRPLVARRALVELLVSEGVDRMFGNPGTTELPVMAELGAGGEIDFVLALQEASAVAMADGYARATRRPAVPLLHIVSGVANGAIGLHNARASHTPLVAVVGQQDRRHLDQGPMLSGNVLGLGAAVCKDAVEVHQAYDLPQVLRRAFQTARTPPAGPVLVVVPMDLLEEMLDEELPARSEVRFGTAADGAADAARLLASATRPALVAGNAVAQEDALDELVALAETSGATVYHQPLFDALAFPLDHPLYAGMLPTSNARIRELLGAHDLVFVVGAHAFAPHVFTVRHAIPSGVSVVQLGSDPAQVGRNYPVALGLVGSVRETLAAIARELAGLGAQPSAPLVPVERFDRLESVPADPRDPRAAGRELAEALPEDVIVVEEAITSGLHLRPHLRLRRGDQYHHTIGGGLGWGIGASIGVKLAKPDRPVVAVLGDGSALFSIQGLWSAARYRVPVAFVVLNNRQYRAVKQGLPEEVEGTRVEPLGVDLTEPEVDLVGVARGFGVAAEPVEPGGIREALERALASGRPSLLDVPIAGR